MPDRVHAWLQSLPAERLRALAAEYADGLAEDGLTVYRGDEDRFVPITPCLTPQAIGDHELSSLAADAHELLAAAAEAAHWTLSEEGRAWGARLYTRFTPLENRALHHAPARVLEVATARVDYFPGPAGARALELNATIPAMQGYSDLIAHRWLRLVARERGFRPDEAELLVARAGSNTADLLASLVAHYRRLGGGEERPSIAIVSRRGDSQLGELRHYVRAFTAAGHRAMHVYVDELELDEEGRVRALGQPFDLVYRHIFARRVDPASVLGHLLVHPGKAVVLNPVLSPLEVKGLLALLHQTVVDGEPGPALSDEQREVVARLVPWTRLCAREPASLPDGGRVDDLVAWAADHPERLVLKRSWDYGGKGVHIGPDSPGWAGLCERAAEDENPWVFQELVAPSSVRHLLVGRDDTRAVPIWREVFVDLSGFANLGVVARPRGGVCRASSSKIVNIASGGGVAPLIARSILDDLFR